LPRAVAGTRLFEGRQGQGRRHGRVDQPRDRVPQDPPQDQRAGPRLASLRLFFTSPPASLLLRFFFLERSPLSPQIHQPLPVRPLLHHIQLPDTPSHTHFTATSLPSHFFHGCVLPHPLLAVSAHKGCNIHAIPKSLPPDYFPFHSENCLLRFFCLCPDTSGHFKGPLHLARVGIVQITTSSEYSPVDEPNSELRVERRQGRVA
jgi:hypothetical protein